jgi:hypothetical protein
MFTQITRLYYWKSEHEEETCEDACNDDSTRGLFAIADGAGTTLFSNIWAKVLVECFVSLPLLSEDPFEVEWWVRQAQELYKQRMPQLSNVAWNAQQKMQSEASYATLATLRISRIQEDAAQAEFLSIGDSCIFLRKAQSEQFTAFPVMQVADFDKPPICFPSKLSLFNRSFHRCITQSVTLSAGDTLLLATDAVSRWLVSAGKGRFAQPIDAWQALCEQTAESWPAFIRECRERNEMVDDDSTALLLSIHDSAEPGVSLLGTTREHAHEPREQRKHDYERAYQENNKELVAIYYGDGTDLALEGLHPDPQEIAQARQVADALRAVLQALRQSLNSPDVAARTRVIWNQYASLLQAEPCASNLRQTLMRLGVIAPPVKPSSLTPSLPGEPQPSSPPAVQEPAATASESKLSPQELEHAQRKLELERRFVSALRADDDEQILAAHQAIQQSPTYSITFTQQELERIALAHQRIDKQQHIMHMLRSQNIEQMASAYALLPSDSSFLTPSELQSLKLAHEFVDARHSGNDDKIVTIYEAILHSDRYSAFSFTENEQDLVARIWKQRVQQTNEEAELAIRQATDALLSEDAFEKLCLVKTRYLAYKFRIHFQPDAIENLALNELTDDQYIRQGIDEINRSAKKSKVNVESPLAQEVKGFRKFLAQNDDEFLARYHLSERDLTTLLGIFVRAEVFAKYLQQHEATTLYDWLNQRKSSQSIIVRRNTPQQRPWYQFLGRQKGT